MWLSDSLPQHISAARIMIYGYASGLDGSESTQNLSDLGQTFHSSVLQPLQVSITLENIENTPCCTSGNE